VGSFRFRRNDIRSVLLFSSLSGFLAGRVFE